MPQSLTLHMADKKPKDNLTDLLDEVEKAHKAEIQLYTSGHLNHAKLFKPKECVMRNYWESAKQSAFILRKRTQSTAPSEASRKTNNTLGDVSDSATPAPTRAKTASHSYRQRLTSKASSGGPVSTSLSAVSFKIQRKAAPKEKEEEADIPPNSQKSHIKEELDIPLMRMLKYKPTMNSRLVVREKSQDEYQFLPSYLAGVTKMDQFHKFMQFQKDFIVKKDLLKTDYIGNTTAEHYERKLTWALRNICDCNRPHFNRLQAVAEVFEEICNCSLIFGDTLKEVKNEYELYMVILLDSLPTMQYRTLQNELKGMEKRTVKTHEIEEARHEMQLLIQKSKWALERNEELRNELEIELWVTQSVSNESELPSAIQVEKPLSSGELLASLRCQVLAKWEEIKAMEKEIKETMTFAGTAHIREKTIKELEGEASKLKASNKFLIKQVKDAEQAITSALWRQKVSAENQRHLWELVLAFLTPERKEDDFENLTESLETSGMSLLSL